MSNAVREAGLAPEDITYINAHGTTHHNDLFETRAIKKRLESTKNLRINSTKSIVGHMLGAAGAIEFITCVKRYRRAIFIPPWVIRYRMRSWISTMYQAMPYRSRWSTP